MIILMKINKASISQFIDKVTLQSTYTIPQFHPAANRIFTEHALK